MRSSVLHKSKATKITRIEPEMSEKQLEKPRRLFNESVFCSSGSVLYHAGWIGPVAGLDQIAAVT